MSDRDLTPEEEAEVSRMLRDLPPVAMPEDVHARLDEVLAGLSAERETGPLADVVPLKRRRWPQVLLAAAAVSLFGYVGTTFLDAQSNDADEAGTASADREVAGTPEKSQQEDSLRPPKPTGLSGNAPDAPGAGVSDQSIKELAGALVDRDRLQGANVGDIESWEYARDGERVFRSKSGVCAVPRLEKGERSYELTLSKRRMVVVVLHPLTAHSSRADVYACARPVLPVGSKFVLGVR
jgi:hypothetical protein